MTTAVEAAVTQAFRDEWGQVVATLIRVTGDWDLAEECAQDAFALALQRWPRDGVPQRPGAWLTTTARNRATDRLRRAAIGAAKLREVAVMSRTQEPGAGEPGTTGPGSGDDSGVPDDLLRLMFTCCHPALALESQVALTLRTLAGLSTAEIARAFLVTEQTMSKRLVRAKQKIRNAGIPYRVPPPRLLPRRTPAVLAVLYLLFNEGYAATAGAEMVRHKLTGEAIRLTRVLARLMPDEPEAAGLLALMLLHDARRRTRLDDAGDLVTLEDQDRSRWDAAKIAEGVALLDGALEHGRQARIRYRPRSRPVTPPRLGRRKLIWAQIAALYGQLARLVPSPVVELNRAVAVSMADGRPRAWSWWKRWRRRERWPGITCCRPSGPTCCAVLAAARRPRQPTAPRWSWRRPTPNAVTCTAGSRKPLRAVRCPSGLAAFVGRAKPSWKGEPDEDRPSRHPIRRRPPHPRGQAAGETGRNGRPAVMVATGTDIQAVIAAERTELAAMLAALPAGHWDRQTLCAGWRVREVVAHMTMPFRYSTLRFIANMVKARGDFAAMADRCARRDADRLRPGELTAALRDNAAYPWKPPGGGFEGALTHDVVHGLDITTALGIGRRVPEDRLRIVLRRPRDP